MKKGKNKGISLIVLVVTIIVMIILAGSIIITLSNSGIIGKANDAVDKTNLKQLQEIANVLWLDAYAGGAKTQEDLQEAVTEGLSGVNTSKYNITVTTQGVTVTLKDGVTPDDPEEPELPQLNEHKFYYDVPYKGTIEENFLGFTKIALVFHEDGSAEGYVSSEDWGDNYYCYMFYEADSFTYSEETVTMVNDNSISATFENEGLSIEGLFEGFAVEGTASFEEVHGIYYNREYTGTMSGVTITGVIKNDTEGELITKITYPDGTVTTTKADITITSIGADGHYITAIDPSGLEGPLPVSLDGKSVIFGNYILTIEGSEAGDGNTDVVFDGTNPYEGEEWEIAWAYQNGAWVEIPKDGNATGDFVAKLYPTGEKITPTSNNELIQMFITNNGLGQGDAYAFVIEGSGEVPAIYNEDVPLAWAKYDVLGEAPYYMTYVTEGYICSGITNVVDSYLALASSLRKVEMTSDVTKIGNYAFQFCDNLRNIDISDNVISIGQHTFFGTGLTQIVIPDSVREIGSKTFEQCHNLVSVRLSKNLTSIQNYTFAECESLTSIDIPDSVNTIGDNAFGGCTSLSTVIMSDNVTTIGTSAFEGCSFSSIALPRTLTQIGVMAFENCTNLTSINIPGTVEYLNTGSFAGCMNLSNVTFNEGTKYIDGFSNCTSLTSISIPSTAISVGGFYGCTGLTSVVIPSNVTTIEGSAFANCTNLKTIEIKYNGSSHVWIRNNAFMNIATGSTIRVYNQSTKNNFTAGTNYDASKTTIVGP